jgi:DNA modification methylase
MNPNNPTNYKYKDTELAPCKVCNKMTNHLDGYCQKHLPQPACLCAGLRREMNEYINKIICGDCLEELAKIKGDFVIVTDPPFNIGYHYSNYKDNMEEGEYYSWLAEVFKFSPFVCIHYPESLYKLSWKVEEIPEKVISWVYNSNTAKQHRDIAFFGIKPDFRKLGQPFKNPKDKRIMKRIADGKQARGYDWWNINQVKNVSKDKTSHPCQMPVEIMENIIKLIPSDKLIVDPFAGSGTTGVACKNLNRNFILIEKEEKYCKIGQERLDKITQSLL